MNDDEREKQAEHDYWTLFFREHLWGLGPDKPKIGLRAIIDGTRGAQ